MADPFALPVVYTIPQMEQARVKKNIVYKTVGDTELLADVYYPEGDGSPRPAVIFVHGEADPAVLRFAKDWGQYVSWGQLAAASGLIGITFTHRAVEGLTKLAEAVGDVHDLVAFVRKQAGQLGVDASRICIWTCSAGGAVGLPVALSPDADYVRCIVSYYAYMDLQHLEGWLGDRLPPQVTPEQLREFSPLRLMQALPAVPPMLVVRAGLDSAPQLNESIDHFVAEALRRNVPLSLVNLPAALHAFDIREATDWAQAIIKQTLEFMQMHLQ